MAKNFGELSQYNVASGKWKTHMEQMEFFFVANDIADAKKKKAIFLASCGTETYTILKSVATPINILEEKFTYEAATKLLTSYFCPAENIIIQRFKFYRRNQKKDELITEYLAALRKLSQDCNFNDLEEMLRDRLVCGMRDENLQKRLLANDQLTLKIAQEEAIASETAQKNATELKTSASLPVLNKISNNKVKPNRAPVDHVQNCYRCRGNHHSDQCKFKDAECYYCKKRGYIERACIKKAKIKKPATNNGRRPNRVNLLDTNQETQTTEYLWSMFAKGSPSVKRVITIEKNLELSGEAEVPVSVGNVTKKLKLLVAAGDGPALIGRNWFNDLGITITSNLCNIESTIPVKVMNFSSVFDGNFGDYKGNPVKLQMSVSSKPKFLRYRHVPFALKLKVEAALKKLEDEGALRSISFSKWATPVVPIIKPDGSIRICGDYKCTVNQMLCKETYPLPTNTEVLAALRHSNWRNNFGRVVG
ncbi:uncharacterized protein K02A2.6-like [Teleopsis dalmanni]|uniref:uncharacterized protein K02A2.6-like n=1 Tax=Teleopsis dalmanni TaxID=139649 RepID=UPI0018CD87A2|nr:uncharacterized protein K02A2.6-like [Teleopsis dalmanni]